MKIIHPFRKWRLLGGAALAAGMCLSTPAQSQTNKLRVGVYDSRVIAVAYANSNEFQEAMKPTLEDHKKAKEAKDEKRLKEIDARMRLRQRRAHEQAFSTGSVIGIMDKVKNSLPAVAKEAGVALIVSKWEVNFQSPNVEIVDVTDKIAALFHIREQGKKWLKQIPLKEPIPIEQITDDMD